MLFFYPKTQEQVRKLEKKIIINTHCINIGEVFKMIYIIKCKRKKIIYYFLV